MNLKQHDIEAYLVLGAENKRYISGFTGSESAVVVVEQGGLFLTDGRYQLQSKEEVKDIFEIKIIPQGSSFIEEIFNFLKKKNITKIGFDGNHMSYATFNEYKSILKDVSMIDVPQVIENMRICKNKDEINKIKKAVEITDQTLNYCLQFLKEGIEEREFANKLDYYHQEFGAKEPSFNTIVAFGDHSALPHAQPSSRRLKLGDIIKVDFGCFYKGYCSDMTRTFFFGKPRDEELVKIHNIVLEAHELQLKAVKVGASTKQIDEIGRDFITKKGYGELFKHGTGHGIGLEIHESPRLNQTSDIILKEGMVITIEPGIYIDGLGGVRIENDVVVTKDGYESLNKTDKSYDLYNKTQKSK